MERKIGEIFEDTNGKRIVCVKAIDRGSCEGCIYLSDAHGCNDNKTRGMCDGEFRSDYEDVIFKKADADVDDADSITKEQFDRYLRLRDMGTINMLDFCRGAMLICEPIEVYRTIVMNFSKLYNKFYNK